MKTFSDPREQALRRLRAALVRRRFSQLEVRLRVELGVLAMLLGSFVFWQVRAPLAGVRLSAGAGGVLAVLTVGWLLLAVITFVLVGVRHVRRLRPAGRPLPWLTLPLEPRQLAGHLRWEAASASWWMAIPAAGFWTAALGLLPTAWLLLLAAPFAWGLGLAGRAGAAVAERLALWGLPAGKGAPVERALAAVTRDSASRRLPAARWERRAAWLALVGKDWRLSLRVPSVGRSLAAALLFWGLSIAAWRLPAAPGLPSARSLGYLPAFVLALTGSAVFGEWLVSLAGSDPFATLRVLPLRLGSVWGARFAWAVAGAALLVLGHAALARDLSPHALRLFLAWVGVATLAIAALAVNYGVTLFPRADLAQRMLGLSLGLAVAGSLMIPLLGWVVLASAVLHSTRRLPRWSRLEEA